MTSERLKEIEAKMHTASCACAYRYGNELVAEVRRLQEFSTYLQEFERYVQMKKQDSVID